MTLHLTTEEATELLKIVDWEQAECDPANTLDGEDKRYDILVSLYNKVKAVTVETPNELKS